MPSEQKGAYGGHLALLSGRHGEHASQDPAYVRTPRDSTESSVDAFPP